MSFKKKGLLWKSFTLLLLKGTQYKIRNLATPTPDFFCFIKIELEAVRYKPPFFNFAQ